MGVGLLPSHCQWVVIPRYNHDAEALELTFFSESTKPFASHLIDWPLDELSDAAVVEMHLCGDVLVVVRYPRRGPTDPWLTVFRVERRDYPVMFGTHIIRQDASGSRRETPT